jgi:hypothetical protein
MYQKVNNSYETIPENPGIRQFVWEHFENLNRVVQRMKYCGGTFSSPKLYLCILEIFVLGHCQGTPVAYPPVTGQGHLNRCGSAKAG